MELAVVIETLDEKLIRSLPLNIIREFRIDLDPSLLEFVENNNETFNFKYILTLRSEREGGQTSTLDRSTMLMKMINLKPSYIDLEIETDLDILSEIDQQTIPVLSKHDYSGTMVQCSEVFIQKYQNLNNSSYVIKFVGKPVDSYDMLKSLKLLRQEFSRYIFLGIGDHGLLSRTMGKYFGQEFVFASINGGLIPPYSLLSQLQKDAIFLGLIGKELSHSYSPIIHHLLLDEIQKDGYYHLLEVHNDKNLREFLELLRETPMLGANVTYPYKDLVGSFLGRSQDDNQPINTIIFQEKLEMLNTDITGFRKLYNELEINDQIREIVIVGAGGAAKSVVRALEKEHFKIHIVNRSSDRFSSWDHDLASRVNMHTFDDFDRVNGMPKVYINATSVGWKGDNIADSFPIPESAKWVIDLNYDKEMTPLIKTARALDKFALDGTLMLFHQAIDAFEKWTNSKIDRNKVLPKFMELIQ